MARITQIAGAVAVMIALAIYVYFIVLGRASGYETAFQAIFIAALLSALGLVGAIGATVVLRREVSPSALSIDGPPWVFLSTNAASQSHPRNVPGPFYVVNECCTACGIPESIAPQNFAYDEGWNCYVTRQPESADEVEKMLYVMRAQDLGCIRYRGNDTEILQRLADADAGGQCDAQPTFIVPVSRNHVSFVLADTNAHTWRGVQVLEDFAGYLRLQRREYRMTPVVQNGDEAYISISWFEDNFHRVAVRSINRENRQWLVRHSFGVGLSETIDDWLSQVERFNDVQWYSEAQWNDGMSGQRRPW